MKAECEAGLKEQMTCRRAHLTTLSSLSSLRRLISRMAVDGTPSSSASNLIFLSATTLFVLISRAL